MPAVKPMNFRGTRDFLPEVMIARDQLLGTIKESFELFGFAPMETPAMEYMETLSGKYGEEGEKLIYRLAYKGGSVLALRYDLTIPLARVVGQYPQIVKPFKRYQIQPVWRADRPQIQQGRFREFVQCDVDIVGTDSPGADAEILALTVSVLERLDIGSFTVRVNHRHLLSGLVEAAGFHHDSFPSVCRGLDKWDKIGPDGVREELLRSGLPPAPVDRLRGLVEGGADLGARRRIRSFAGPVAETKDGPRGLAALTEIFDQLEAYEIPEGRIALWPSLARGLDYYTGAIFESVHDDLKHLGSLTGGGRYDDLIGIFSDEPVPATGTSIGIERILSALEQTGRLASRASRTQVFVSVFDESSIGASLRIAGRLRRAGIRTEVAYEAQKLKRQFARADRLGIPLVVVQGPDEKDKGMVSVKRLATGEQSEVAEEGIADLLAAMLAEG